MIEVRQGFFETNSSSVHALVIPKDTKIVIPKKVFLSFGEYGWESDTTHDTLNYIYQACVDNGKEELDKLFEYLKRKGVEEIHSPEINWTTTEYNGDKYSVAENSEGYVDHSYEIPLDTLFANEDLLDRFLFSEDSFVQTGNDNSDNWPHHDDYDNNIYDVLMKGN